ncbi:hypothetical protein DPM13_00965 [Paracoccus mutanolyticus]|uniref:Uncharacterized protein n=1 Tax=Paracoccus mutanolyticus TaxID=1499308 RepID=A0ABM6WNZ4_9RHOB|nr:hypothetical protein DPM13_00965 [Paracoccus mutanolyticus]
MAGSAIPPPAGVLAFGGAAFLCRCRKIAQPVGPISPWAAIRASMVAWTPVAEAEDTQADLGRLQQDRRSAFQGQSA